MEVLLKKGRSHQNSRLEPKWVKKKEVEVANTEHLAQLKKGVRSWNEWRIANSSVRPVLSDAYLNGADLRDADLSENPYVMWRSPLLRAGETQESE